jgi:hypothetical protein
MPEWDFGRLRTLVSTYEEHDKTVDQLNDHPNRRTRNQVRGILGLPLQGPELHMQSEMFDFPMYDLRGWRSKTAVNRRVIKLEPKHIQQVTFTRVVEVSN